MRKSRVQRTFALLLCSSHLRVLGLPQQLLLRAEERVQSVLEISPSLAPALDASSTSESGTHKVRKRLEEGGGLDASHDAQEAMTLGRVGEMTPVPVPGGEKAQEGGMVGGETLGQEKKNKFSSSVITDNRGKWGHRPGGQSGGSEELENQF